MTEVQVYLENIGHLNRRLSVVVPIAQLEQTKKQRLSELAKTTALDGFRPGKVPVRVIEKRYGESVWWEVVQQSLRASLFDALEKNALNPAGKPQIDSVKAEPGNDLEYTATFEIFPQVSIPELKGLSLEKLNVEITEANVDAMLEKMRHQYVDWVEVSRTAQQGDKIIFDLTRRPDGEALKDVALVLEEGKMPEGFSVLLASAVGSAAGETISALLPTGKDLEQEISATIDIKKNL